MSVGSSEGQSFGCRASDTGGPYTSIEYDESSGLATVVPDGDFANDYRKSDGPIAVYDGSFVRLNQGEYPSLVEMAVMHLSDEAREVSRKESDSILEGADPRALENAALDVGVRDNLENFVYSEDQTYVWSMSHKCIDEL